MERVLGVRFEALITKNPEGTINSGDFPILTVGGAAVGVLPRSGNRSALVLARGVAALRDNIGQLQGREIYHLSNATVVCGEVHAF